MTKILKLNSNTIDIIKYLAIIFMIIDHTKILYEYRYIPIIFELGRLSFPLFAIVLSYNYVHNTSNQIKYIKRLFLFALISQGPYYLYEKAYIPEASVNLNIFFILAGGLFVNYTYNKLKETKNMGNIILNVFILMITVTIVSLSSDYKPLNIFFILSTILLVKKESFYTWILFIILAILMNATFLMAEGGYTSIFSREVILSMSIIPLILILIKKINKNPLKINKFIFYFLYPIQFFIFYILKVYLFN